MPLFDTYKYQSDAGEIYQIRLSDATKGITGNTEPAGALTDGKVEVKVSDMGRKRKYGISPRGVTLRRTTGTGAARKVYYKRVAALTPDAQAAIFAAETITINSVAWTPYDTINEE